MPQIPDRLTNKTAQFFRNAIALIGVAFGLLSWGAFRAGEPGSGLILALIAGGALFGAAKIKVHYRLKGGVAVYE